MLLSPLQSCTCCKAPTAGPAWALLLQLRSKRIPLAADALWGAGAEPERRRRTGQGQAAAPAGPHAEGLP